MIRRLLALTWSYRWGCIKVIILQTLILGFTLFGIGFTGLGIDEMRHAITPGAPLPHWPFHWSPPASWTPMAVIALIAVAVLAAALLRGTLDYLYRVAANHLLQVQVVVALRAGIYDKLQRLSFRFYDANASGSIINRVTSDVQSARMFIDQVLIQSLIVALTISGCLILMLNIHIALTVACLATTPLLVISSRIFSRIVQPGYLRNRTLVDAMIQRLTENIRGILVVKAFGRERDEIRKFREVNETVRAQKRKIFWQISIYTPLVGFLSQINIIVLLGYGGYLVVDGKLPLGTGIIVFAGILQLLSGQISNISTIANSLQESLIAARRVFEVLDAPLEIQNSLTAIKIPRARGELRFENVSFTHNEISSVLEEVTFDVRPGQCVAIIGPTGSGKSTLLSLLPRFYDPTRGRILLDGNDLREIEIDSLRRNVGLVFQESFLFSTTVSANIAFGHPAANREQIERAARIAAAHDFIMELPDGYDTVLGESGIGLSGGQRQRLAIARAVLLDPAILILDDPTAAVDPGTEHEIADAMDSAMQNRTTFLVAHRLSMLARADRIIVLDRGRIAHIGTHEELLKRPGYYSQIAQIQSDAGTTSANHQPAFSAR